MWVAHPPELYLTYWNILFLKNVFVKPWMQNQEQHKDLIYSFLPDSVFHNHTHHDADWILGYADQHDHWSLQPLQELLMGLLKWIKQGKRPGWGAYTQTKLIVDFLQSTHSIINLVLCLNYRCYIINPLSNNQYSYSSTTRIIPFLEKLVVRISPWSFPSWLTPPSWFLHTANIYQFPWHHFNIVIASAPHSTHI